MVLSNHLKIELKPGLIPSPAVAAAICAAYAVDVHTTALLCAEPPSLCQGSFRCMLGLILPPIAAAAICVVYVVRVHAAALLCAKPHIGARLPTFFAPSHMLAYTRAYPWFPPPQPPSTRCMQYASIPPPFFAPSLVVARLPISVFRNLFLDPRIRS